MGINPKKTNNMKKFLTTFAILAAFAVMPANAQIEFGVKGGLSYPNMKFNYDNIVNKSGSGWFVGPTLKATLPIGLIGIGADIAAFYDQRHTKTEVNGIEQKIKQKSILIPLNARVNISIFKTLGAYVATGPQFGFNLGDKDYNIFGNNSDEAKDNVKNTFQLKKSQFSWNIGLGIMFLKHFEVGATYNLSIGKTGEIKNMTKEEIEDAPKQKSWAISAAYYF